MGILAEQLEALAEHMKSAIPAKRFGSSEEMAKVVLFLASSESSYLYGSAILADGGIGSI